MRDDWSGGSAEETPGNAGDDALALQALLYASGELEEAEAAEFEERLAADQTARDALCQAVQLTETLAGNPARSCLSRPGPPPLAATAALSSNLGRHLQTDRQPGDVELHRARGRHFDAGDFRIRGRL
jgi:hypothetical protein